MTLEERAREFLNSIEAREQYEGKGNEPSFGVDYLYASQLIRFAQSVRNEALEEAAAWHDRKRAIDERCGKTPDSFQHGFQVRAEEHATSADAIRSLKSPTTEQTK